MPVTRGDDTNVIPVFANELPECRSEGNTPVD